MSDARENAVEMQVLVPVEICGNRPALVSSGFAATAEATANSGLHWGSELAQYLSNYVSMHIGQPSLNAVVIERESFVVEAQQVQDGRMEVVSGGDVLLGTKSKLVSRAIAATRFHSSPGQPTGEAMRIVIASVSARLKHGHAAKLGRKDNQR